MKRAGDLPVYTVRPKNRDGPLRTLHRDLLLPCGFLPGIEEEKSVPPTPVRRPRTRQHPGVEDTEDVDIHSDSEDDVSVHWSTDPQVLRTTRFTTIHECHKSREQPSTAHAVAEDTPSSVPPTSDVPVEPPPTPQVVEYAPVSSEVDDLPGDAPVTVVDDLPDVAPAREENDLPVDAPELPEVPVEEPEDTDPATENVPVEITEEENEQVTDEVTGEQTTSQKGETIKDEHDSFVRRSARRREEPHRLQYSELGKPLISIVQSLFQGLSIAFTDALNGYDYPKPLLSLPIEPVTRQPFPCNGTCIALRGEDVTQVK